MRALGGELYGVQASGMEQRFIQRLLGHSTEKMTKHYLDKHAEQWNITDAVGLPPAVCQK